MIKNNIVTVIDTNHYVLAAEQNSYLCPEGSKISAADNYITLQGYIFSCPEGVKMSLCLCGCGEECKEGCLYRRGHGWRGKHHSEETKEKMRLVKLGKKESEETKERKRLSMIGKNLKYDGENNPFYGKHHSDESKEKMRLAKLGKILSEEHKEKLRLANLGKHHSEESKQKIRLGHVGKTHTEEAKEKIRLSKLGNKFTLGKKRSEESKRKMAERKIGYVPWIKGRKGIYHHSEEWKNKFALAFLGESNPNWKGGTSFLPYCNKFNDRLKEQIRERDGRKCQICGRTELQNSRKLSVHHVHYDKENCYPDLLAICFKCNSVINGNRDYWEKKCMRILEKRGLLNWKPVNVTLLENSARLVGG